MSHFFVDPADIKRGQALITGPDVKHIQKVLRLGIGDTVTLFDGQGNKYQANIADYSREAVYLKIIKKEVAEGEPPINVTVVQCLPKGDKMDLVIQKGTELGVSRFIPLKCSRSVVKLDSKKGLERQKRWQKIALAAAKQCRRPMVPEVTAPMDWPDVLANVPPDALLLIPWEGETSTSIRDVLSQKYQDVYIVIGPEGGFEPHEIDAARRYKAKTVSLGPRILRTETTGLALISIIMYLHGDLG